MALGADLPGGFGPEIGTFVRTILKTPRGSPICESMGVLAMTVTQASLTVVGAMVVLVVVTAELETHTPAPRARATRWMFPRRIAGSAEELPVVDLAELRRRMVLADSSASVGFEVEGTVAAGSETVAETAAPVVPFDEPIREPAPEPEPVTELVPVVVMTGWLEDLRVEPEAEEVLVRLRAGREEATLSKAPATVTPIHAAQGSDLGPPTEPVELVALSAVPGDARIGGPVSGGTSGQRPSTVFVAAVDSPGAAWVELGEPGADRQLAGVLFAGYVAGGFPERSRVTGWVTPLDAPPGRPALYRGAKLRGRPTRIRELLACDDDGRNWVGLDPSVDIKRGLQQRKPADDALKGLLWWWLAATDERALVPADHVTELHDGLAAVVDHLTPNVMEPMARELLAICEVAMRAGVGVRVKSLSSDTIEARERRESLEGETSLVAAG